MFRSKVIIRKLRILVLTILIGLLGAGCKETLYGDLGEQEANEMLAILLDNCISAKKIPGKKGRVILTVDSSQINHAINALRRNGYPKEAKNEGLMEDGSMISSPTQEKMRQIMLLSQELSHTLKKLDGVVDARAHIVLAEDDKLGRPVVPASVGIFIKHVSGMNMKRYVSKIKAVVQHGVPGVDIDNISVAMVEAEEESQDNSFSQCEVEEEGDHSGTSSLWIWLIISLVIIAINIAIFVLWWQSKDKSKIKNM